MIYIIIDACIGGTGIRDKYLGGYIEPQELNLNIQLIDKLNLWLAKYENEYYYGFKNEILINELDEEGVEISLLIANELSDVKIEYFSDATLKTQIIK